LIAVRSVDSNAWGIRWSVVVSIIIYSRPDESETASRDEVVEITDVER
jgi:hypothetical protein